MGALSLPCLKQRCSGPLKILLELRLAEWPPAVLSSSLGGGGGGGGGGVRERECVCVCVCEGVCVCEVNGL